jgi:hypothetical protein
MEELLAYRLEGWPVQFKEVRVAAGKYGDLAACREMHAAGDRAFEGTNPVIGGDARQIPDLVASERRHLDPTRARLQALKHLPQHLLGDGRRRQAGDHAIDLVAERARRIGPPGSSPDMRLRPRAVAVIDRELEAATQETRGEVASEISEPDEAVAHRAHRQRTRIPAAGS